jgi:hypothetical protein
MNYPMQAYGLGGLNTVQNMSDRNAAETLMANGGQRFAGGGISNIQRMAAGGIPRYTYDPITGKYTPVDAATAASSDVPKYTYDPVTQRYTLETSILETKKEGSGNSDAGSSGSEPAAPSPFSALSPSERAAYYAANPTMASITQLGQKGFGLTSLGMLQNYFDPSIQANAGMEARGIDPGTGLMGQGTRGPTGLHGDLGIFGLTADQQSAVNASQNAQSMQSMQDAYNADMSAASQGQGGGVSDTNSPGADAASAANAGENAAKGGLMGLAQGGISHLGDYSDGGRLLRGPGDGVSDSIPATIANKRPARLADGEFVVPARIVSELGNGSTEAGARKLYQMLARVQNARKKSIGQGRVAVNSRADKMLPA